MEEISHIWSLRLYNTKDYVQRIEGLVPLIKGFNGNT